MIELGILIRLARLLSSATRILHGARAVPGTLAALLLMRFAGVHERTSRDPS
jgi:hypothetical protein